MEKGKYPIIANGELYVEPISKKMNFPPKEWPHDYNDAKIMQIPAHPTTHSAKN